MATQFGVAASVIEEIRGTQLVEGTHWFVQGRKVSYLPDGLTRVASILEVKKEAPDPDAVQLLQVTGLLPNVRVVRVKTPEGSSAEVRVRDNRRLHVRHLLRCRLDAGRWICVQPGIAPL